MINLTEPQSFEIMPFAVKDNLVGGAQGGLGSYDCKLGIGDRFFCGAGALD